VKSIQALDRRTRSDMAIGLLGWSDILSFIEIEIRRLLFFGGLCRLNQDAVSIKVLLTIMIQYCVGGNCQMYGFVPNVFSITLMNM